MFIVSLVYLQCRFCTLGFVMNVFRFFYTWFMSTATQFKYKNSNLEYNEMFALIDCSCEFLSLSFQQFWTFTFCIYACSFLLINLLFIFHRILIIIRTCFYICHVFTCHSQHQLSCMDCDSWMRFVYAHWNVQMRKVKFCFLVQLIERTQFDRCVYVISAFGSILNCTQLTCVCGYATRLSHSFKPFSVFFSFYTIELLLWSFKIAMLLFVDYLH